MGKILVPVTALPDKMQEHTPPTPGRAKDMGRFHPGTRSEDVPHLLLPRFMLKPRAAPTSDNRIWGFCLRPPKSEP